MRTFTVITPLRPTFFIALEMIAPTSVSPLAEIVATYEHEGLIFYNLLAKLMILSLWTE